MRRPQGPRWGQEGSGSGCLGEVQRGEGLGVHVSRGNVVCRWCTWRGREDKRALISRLGNAVGGGSLTAVRTESSRAWPGKRE